jgi:hypothetical protein
MAHVLELSNKLRLEGPLWLAVQQQLYIDRLCATQFTLFVAF